MELLVGVVGPVGAGLRLGPAAEAPTRVGHPGGSPGANLKSISHICHPILVAFVWELTKESIDFPLGCLQGGAGVLEGAAAQFRERVS